MSMDFGTALKTLGLNDGYSLSDLNAAYKEKAASLHPDKVLQGTDLSLLSEDEVNELKTNAKQAYQKLGHAKEFLELALEFPNIKLLTDTEATDRYFRVSFQFQYALPCEMMPTPHCISFDAIEPSYPVFAAKAAVKRMRDIIKLPKSYKGTYNLHFCSSTHPELLVEIAKHLQESANQNAARITFSEDIKFAPEEQKALDKLNREIKIQDLTKGLKSWSTKELILSLAATCSAILLLGCAPLFEASLGLTFAMQAMSFGLVFGTLAYTFCRELYYDVMQKQAQKSKFDSFNQLNDDEIEAMRAGVQSKTWTGYFETFTNKAALKHPEHYYAARLFAINYEDKDFLLPLQNEINERTTLRN